MSRDDEPVPDDNEGRGDDRDDAPATADSGEEYVGQDLVALQDADPDVIKHSRD